MAYRAKNSNGRVQLVNTDIIIGVVLEDYIQEGAVKVRPTNTTATINLVGSTGTVTDTERSADRIILLHNGPNGGFTQQFSPTAATGDYLVNDVVKGVIVTGDNSTNTV